MKRIEQLIEKYEALKCHSYDTSTNVELWYVDKHDNRYDSHLRYPRPMRESSFDMPPYMSDITDDSIEEWSNVHIDRSIFPAHPSYKNHTDRA